MNKTFTSGTKNSSIGVKKVGEAISLASMNICKIFKTSLLLCSYALGLVFQFIPHCHPHEFFNNSIEVRIDCTETHIHLHSQPSNGKNAYSNHMQHPNQNHFCQSIFCFLECLLSETEHATAGDSHLHIAPSSGEIEFKNISFSGYGIIAIWPFDIGQQLPAYLHTVHGDTWRYQNRHILSNVLKRGPPNSAI